MPFVAVPYWFRPKDNEVSGAEKESEGLELASECHPAKKDIFCKGQVLLLTGCPLMGDPMHFWPNIWNFYSK
jgi:hypothetical protein